ncbi:MAG: 2-C-methyl-D-erythritol 4-phosphate cytidylyltransferase [Thermoleophilaceae bacterium]|nr:2-C-methyl-D-erythritol 4-phosphate cytidylyltransferase [Thermoleophilaceae bacterium]
MAVIAAGGSGERLGANSPKALVLCNGRALLCWSVEAAASARSVVAIVVAAHGDELAQFEELVAECDLNGKPILVVPGGASRSHSVRAGVLAAAVLEAYFNAIVVHDAARPLATGALFDACIAQLADADCVVAAAPVADTIKIADAQQRVLQTPARSGMWAVQTPQAFRRECLESALVVGEDQLAAASDDASLAEANGAQVELFANPLPNPKVTTAADLEFAQLLLARTTET